MQFNQQLHQICSDKNSLLCVGLDVDVAKIPSFILSKKNPQEFFSKAIIEATIEYTAAYKINTAFFEAAGAAGWETMKNIVEFLPADVIKIADAKRGDIGNTSKMYAQAFFEQMDFDAITVNPYLGFDAIEPFLADAEKGVFILCHTTNPGAADFQKFGTEAERLFERVANRVNTWNQKNNCGLVVGATFPDEMKQVRELSPELPFLVPGLGAQGGDFDRAVRYAASRNGGAIFNFSRTIIYAGADKNFAQQAGNEAKKMRDQIQKLLNS